MTGISKIPKGAFGKDVRRLYSSVYKHLKEGYGIDDIAADQIALSIVAQRCVLLPRLLSGEDADLSELSESIRKWLSEYRLTPRSREKERDVTINLSAIVEEIHRERGESK